jgi:hypothetical protein
MVRSSKSTFYTGLLDTETMASTIHTLLSMYLSFLIVTSILISENPPFDFKDAEEAFQKPVRVLEA